MATSKELLEAQANGATIHVQYASGGHGPTVEYQPRRKGDRSPWVSRSGLHWYRYTSARCVAVFPEPEPVEVAEIRIPVDHSFGVTMREVLADPAESKAETESRRNQRRIRVADEDYRSQVISDEQLDNWVTDPRASLRNSEPILRQFHPVTRFLIFKRAGQLEAPATFSGRIELAATGHNFTEGN